ncbi:MAG: MBG domain-containing protein, partial [Micrococcales bacterium]
TLSPITAVHVGDHTISGTAAGFKSGSALDYTVTVLDGTLVITKRTVRVIANNQTKTYGDGNPELTYALHADDSLAFSDAFTGALDSARRNVGDGSITIGTLALTSDYDLQFTGATMTITQRSIKLQLTGGTKVYGESTPDLTGCTLALGTLGYDDELSLHCTIGTLNAVHVDTYTVTGSAAGFNKGSADNYSIVILDGTYTITKRTVRVTADNLSKTYGEANPELTYTLHSDDSLVAGDSFSGVLSSARVHVGTGSIVQNTLALSSDYTLEFTAGTMTVTKRAITVTMADDTKVYGQADPDLTECSLTTGTLAYSDQLDGFCNGQRLNTSNHVGEYAITATDATWTIGSSSDYQITVTAGKFVITPKHVTVEAIAGTKVYGHINPGYGYQLASGSALEAGDGFTGALSRVAGEDVSTYALTLGYLTLGADYQINFVSADFVITKRSITVQLTGASKTYGDDNPDLTLCSITELEESIVSSDQLSGHCSINEVTAVHVGTHTITGTTAGFSAGSASNYTITVLAGDFVITKRTVRVTANNQTKIYGSGNPELTYAIHVDDSLVSGDTFSGVLESLRVHVGTGSIAQGTLALSSDYILVVTDGTMTVTPRAISVTLTGGTKVYGDSNPDLTGCTLTTGELVTGDILAGTCTLNQVTAVHVADHNISGTAAAFSAGSASDYTVTVIDGTFSITKRTLTVTADNQTKTFGDANPSLGYGYLSSDLIAGDSFTGALESLRYNVGTGAITVGTLALSADYNLVFVPAVMTVTKRSISVTVDNATKVYGQADPNLTGCKLTVGSLATGDVITEVCDSARLNTNRNVGTYSITGTTVGFSAGLESNYSITVVPGTLTITEKHITFSAINFSLHWGDAIPTCSASNYTVTGLEYSDALVSEAGCFSTYAERDAVGSYFIYYYSPVATSNYIIDNTTTIAGVTGTVVATSNITVAKRPLTIHAADRTLSYGDADPGAGGFLPEYLGLLPDSMARISTLPVCDAPYDRTSSVATEVGSYTITCTEAVSDYYAITTTTGVLTVAPKVAVVYAGSYKLIYGQSAPTWAPTWTNQGSAQVMKTTALTGVTCAPVDGWYHSADHQLTLVSEANQIKVGGTNFSGKYQWSSDVTCTGGSNPNYAITFVTGAVAVHQRVAFAVPDSKHVIYGEALPALTITAMSSNYDQSPIGLVTGDNLGTGSCWVEDFYVGAPATTYQILCDGLSNTDYDIAFSIGTLYVDPRAATITVDNKTITYGADVPTLGYTVTGLYGEDELLIGPSCSTTYTKGSNVGTYAITCIDGETDTNYVLTVINGSITVNKAAVSVTASNPGNITYGDTAPTITAIVSGLQGADTLALACTTSYTNTTSALTSFTNSCGFANGYSASSYSNYTVTFHTSSANITKRTVSITAHDRTIAFGSALPSVDNTWYTATGFFGTPTVVCTSDYVAGTTGIGTSTISCDSVTDINYNVTVISGVLTIIKASVNVIAGTQTRTYGDAVTAVEPSAFSYITGLTCTAKNGSGTDYSQFSAPGVYTVTCTASETANYDLTFTAGTLTVNKRTLTVKANDVVALENRVPNYTYTSTGLVNGDRYTSNPSCSATFTGTGVFTINCSGAAATNYDIVYQTGTLTVQKIVSAFNVVYNGKTFTYSQPGATTLTLYAGTTDVTVNFSTEVTGSSLVVTGRTGLVTGNNTLLVKLMLGDVEIFSQSITLAVQSSTTGAEEPAAPVDGSTTVVNGETVSTTTSTNTSTGTYTVSGTDFTAGLTSTSPLGYGEDPSGFASNSTITVSLTGYKPNSTVEIYMFSTPVKVGTCTSDANGNVTNCRVNLPTNAAVGKHTLQVNGTTKANQKRSLNIGITVQAAKRKTAQSQTPAAFASKKWVLSTGQKLTLNKVVNALKTKGEYALTISFNRKLSTTRVTDARSAAYGQRIVDLRVQAVVAYMATKGLVLDPAKVKLVEGSTSLGEKLKLDFAWLDAIAPARV